LSLMMIMMCQTSKWPKL